MSEAPHDLPAEESLLGAAIVSPSALSAVSDAVSCDDFYRDSHRHIWRAIAKLYAAGKDVDQITVSAALSADGLLEACGGKQYIHTLASCAFNASGARGYAEIVARNAAWRNLADVGNQIASMAYEHPEDPDTLIERSERLLYGVRRHARESDGAEVAESLESMVKAVDDSLAGKKTIGRSTHFPSIDSIIGGFAPGTFNILAARPKVGKSALVTNMARHLSEECHVVFFSLEMSQAEIWQRMYCADAGVDITKVRAGLINNAEYARLINAIGAMEKMSLYIDDSSFTMAGVRSKIRRQATRHPLGLVIIDYVQLLNETSSRRQENRQQEMSDVSRQLKMLSREYDVPVLAVAQLKRPPSELAHTPRPRLSDIKESGAFEQDADLVMALHRKDTKEDEEWDGRIEFIVLAHRNGPSGHMFLKYKPTTCQFKDDA